MCSTAATQVLAILGGMVVGGTVGAVIGQSIIWTCRAIARLLRRRD